jgi:hypothetical protein
MFVVVYSGLAGSAHHFTSQLNKKLDNNKKIFQNGRAQQRLRP